MNKALNQINKIRQNMQTQPITKSNGSPIQILAWGANPFVITGFGVVMKEIFSNLFRTNPGKYNIRQVGINYFGDAFDPDVITGGPTNGIYQQWPAMQANVPAAHSQVHQYGQYKFLQVLATIDPALVDVIFLCEDPFMVGGAILGTNEGYVDKIKQTLAERNMSHIPIVSYFPIDGIPKAVWLHNICKTDFPVTYLNFGKQYISKIYPELDKKLSIIPHGINQNEFFPVPEIEARRFRRLMFGDVFVDKFMLLNVNRNQQRKMLPSTLIAFSEFKKVIGDNKAFIYMNMRPVDVGWNLYEVCNSLGLQVGKDVLFPAEFNVQVGLSIEELNLVFNTADLLVTSATGGGWEFALTQAFATKTCVLAPANTSHVDLCGDQNSSDGIRGMLYASGDSLSLRTIFSNDNEVLRPLPNVEDMIQKMLFLYNNPNVRAQIETNAYNWVTSTINWNKNVVPLFDQVFTHAKKVKEERLTQINK